MAHLINAKLLDKFLLTKDHFVTKVKWAEIWRKLVDGNWILWGEFVYWLIGHT